MELKAKWAQFIGPALAPGLAALAKTGVTDLANADIGVMAGALGELFLRMDPAEVRPLICETLTFTTVVVADEKGIESLVDLSNSVNIEAVFEDHEADSLKVLWFALKVNFAGLFPEGAMEKLTQVLVSGSP